MVVTPFFCLDKWLIDEPIVDLCLVQLDSVDLYKSINDYWELGEGWKWVQLNGIIPSFFEEKLASF